MNFSAKVWKIIDTTKYCVSIIYKIFWKILKSAENPIFLTTDQKVVGLNPAGVTKEETSNESLLSSLRSLFGVAQPVAG